MKRKVLIVATVVKQHILTFHLPVLEWFQKQGWETHVAAANDFDRSEECRIPFCDVYHPISFSRTPFHANNLRAYHELKRLLKQERFALVHTNTPSASVLLRFACRKERKNGTKVIYTAHGFHFYQGTSWRDTPWKNWLLYYPVEKLCARWTDVLITINREDYRLAKTHLPAKQVEYVPGVGVDVKGIAERADRVCREEKRKELGIPEDAVVMVSVGELSENKNQMLALEVLEKWNRTANRTSQHSRCSGKWYYLICGQGVLQEALLQKIRELGLEENARLLGYRKDVIEILAASDIFLFPSKREGLPVALMEAMTVGVPCIVSDIRGNRELVGKGETKNTRLEGDGRWFSLRKPEELVNGIQEMITQAENMGAEEKERRKAKSRKRMRKYSRKVVMKKMERIYQIGTETKI